MCFGYLFSRAIDSEEVDGGSTSKSYLDVLFSKSTASYLCGYLHFAKTLDTATLGDSHLIAELPQLKMWCLEMLQFLCEKSRTETEIVLNSASNVIAECLVEEMNIIERALPLTRRLCNVSPEKNRLLSESCGQIIVSSVVRFVSNILLCLVLFSQLWFYSYPDNRHTEANR